MMMMMMVIMVVMMMMVFYGRDDDDGGGGGIGRGRDDEDVLTIVRLASLEPCLLSQQSQED